MYLFWAAIGLMGIRALAGQIALLRLSGAAEVRACWRRRVLPDSVDMVALCAAAVGFWLADDGAPSLSLFLYSLTFAVSLGFGLIMLKAQLFGWVLLWHNVREQRERDKVSGAGS